MKTREFVQETGELASLTWKAFAAMLRPPYEMGLWIRQMEQIGVRSPGIFVYHPVIDPNPFGYEVALPELNDVATGYQELFADQYLNGGTFHLGWFYLVLALCSAIVLLSMAGADPFKTS